MSVETQPFSVAPSNLEQARAWDGDEGAYWAEHADRFETSVARYDDAFLAAARIGPASRVLDVGCGTGSTTRAAARAATEGVALGVDLSSRMVEVARERAVREGLANARFRQADAQVADLGASSYDVVLSRTSAMFFGDKPAAFANLRRSLAGGGRLVLLVWQDFAANEWLRLISAALTGGRGLPAPPPEAPSPFALADPGRITALLTGAGFGRPRVEGLREPMWFGPDAEDAHAFLLGLSGWMMDGLDDASRRRAGEDLLAALAAHEAEDGVWLPSATWLVTATA
jgi:SAM-dependent methyltransferase